jgi:hypothetical protein
MTKTASTKRGRGRPQNSADASQERLDGTPERLARAMDAGQATTRDPEPVEGRRIRRILDPFDVMRSNRVLARTIKKADRRIPAPHPSARPARRPARGRHRPDRRDLLRPAPRPAPVRSGAPRPRQAAEGRGQSRTRRVADRDPHRHRGRRRARLPRFRPRTRHPLARRRRHHRPPAGRPRFARRIVGGDARAGVTKRLRVRLRASPRGARQSSAQAEHLNGSARATRSTVVRGSRGLSNGWRRLARMLLPPPAPSGTRLPAGSSTAAGGAIVGVKKSALYRDGRGQFRVIDFFLPADLLTDLTRPIEIQFLEGEELVSAENFAKVISVNFGSRESRGPVNREEWISSDPRTW